MGTLGKDGWMQCPPHNTPHESWTSSSAWYGWNSSDPSGRTITNSSTNKRTTTQERTMPHLRSNSRASTLTNIASLFQKWRSPHVPHQLPKHTGPNPPHTCRRILVEHIINPSSLMSDDNGIYQIFLGNNIIVIPNTPANRKAQPWAAH